MSGLQQCDDCGGWGDIYTSRVAYDTRTGDPISDADYDSGTVPYRFVDYEPSEPTVCDDCDGLGVVPIEAEVRVGTGSPVA